MKKDDKACSIKVVGGDIIRVGYMRKADMNREDWMTAANAFALMHGIELFHFTDDKIDFENKNILGEFWDEDKFCFVEKITPFPHIIQDNRFKVLPKVREKLRKSGVILTWISLGGKVKVDRVLRNSPVKKYLIDTFNYDEVDIADMLDKYNKIIITHIPLWKTQKTN